MGRLEHPDEPARPLRTRSLVGRSDACHLRVDDRTVSAEHAVLWWTGDQWLVRDLGSRNGTWLDEVRLEPLVSQPVPQGASLRFGAAQGGFTLASAGPPIAFAVGPNDRHVLGTPALLALPSPEDPEVSLVLTESGWRREGADDAVPAEDLVVAGGTSFRVSLPDPVPPTLERDRAPEDRPDPRLRFRVSRDEEHVELILVDRDAETSLGARSHGETLLFLARARLADRDQGLPDEAQGWVHLDEVIRGLRLTENSLNVHVFRARQQLGEAGLREAHRIIERRMRSFQLRIGLVDLEVVRA